MDEPAKLPQASRMSPLQRLILESRAGRGYSEVSRASGIGEDGKPRVSRQRVEQLEKVPIKRAPANETLMGLAAGLRVPLSTVRDAVAESLGLRTIRDASSRLRMLVDDAEERLSPEKQARLAEMLPTLIEMLERGER